MKITSGKYVEVYYTMKFDGFDGEVIEETTLEDPLKFEVGSGEMHDVFEAKLEGLTVGDKFKFKIPVDEAFGEYDELNQLEIPKSEIGVEKGEVLPEFEAGEFVSLLDEDGEDLPVEILEVRKDTLLIDANHPYAGEDLYFEGTIIAVEGAIK